MVADAVSYSYYHFHRHFLYAMGETVGSYIRSRRLALAASELVHGDKRIIDIAISLNFESAEGFSRAFKSKYRVSPREYRNRGVDVLLANHPPLTASRMPGCSVKPPEMVTVLPKRIVGMPYTMSIADNQADCMWEKLNELLAQESGSPFAGNRYCFYEGDVDCEQATFREETAATAFIGIEHETLEPHGSLCVKRFGGGAYAKFTHRGNVEALLATYRYIWGVWFPQSGCALANREDFECYTERFRGPLDAESEIEIYFPVQAECR